MLIFTIFTLGYFAGVVTALAVFPPRVKEIEEQEFDALQPVLEIKARALSNSGAQKTKATSFGLPITIRSNDLLKADS